ncbi:MAG TPA: molybdopterin molybdenumtransferase MoeA [Candidatus Aerophobetes bacterium]|uniref:Molybdopterin molybdenumtransferase n=1 Tax=Aerophobetes bacterium TaxID=2030807 RepID=A0A7V0N0H4_UNCAE|nr:molybdopterin molybdenumtransferase MoeA [Candidatus Aerophobetes bacterium]
MISVEDALEIVLKQVSVLSSERVKLLSSLGRVLSENIYSDFDIPGFNRAAMDGYAVVAKDTVHACPDRPVTLKVIDEVPAGFKVKSAISSGKAIRIMTGAVLPEGADAVVMVEYTEARGDKVMVFRSVKKGENVSFSGEDVKKGELVLSRGTLIRPQEVGMLAALGKTEVYVTRKPKVAIISTGDELIEPGRTLEKGKIYDSNSFSLFSQVLKCGADPERIGIVPDDKDELLHKVKMGLSSNILLLSGGVSEGKYDLVKEVLMEARVKPLFWKVAVKPGKPTFFGIRERTLVFGLPGYPVSSMMNFENLVKPAIFKMLGREGYKRIKIRAVLKGEIKNSSGRKNFIRVRLIEENGRYLAIPAPSQKSGVLKSMVWANAVVVLSTDVRKVENGEEVLVEVLD